MKLTRMLRTNSFTEAQAARKTAQRSQAKADLADFGSEARQARTAAAADFRQARDVATPEAGESGLHLNWRNLINARVWLAAAFVYMVVGALLSIIWAPLAWAAVPLIPLVIVGYAFAPPVVCPHCHKRVKLGANTCRFCGRNTS